MTVEQIAIRQEIRQMLNEAGINRNVLKDMVKEVLDEEIQKAVKQAINETALTDKADKYLTRRFDSIVKCEISEAVRERISGVFDTMTIAIDITDRHGTSSIIK